jgi:nucleoside-diphosphate-sugar epimerase
MNVLVTGANGLVGRALCAQLAQGGHAAIRTVRSFTSRGEWAVGDLHGNTDWLAALGTGTDAVVHSAARVHVMDDMSPDPLAEFRRVNVDGTLNLARQAAAAGVRRFVFISSVKVNGEATLAGKPLTEQDAAAPQDAYGISKMEAEQGLRQIALNTGMEVVIIRPPLVYGPGVKANFAALMRAVQRGYPLPLGAVHNQRSLVALGNLVDFIITCATHPLAANQTFLVSDGHDLSTAELVRGMAQAAGVRARLLPVPVPLLRAAAAVLGKAGAVDRLCGNLQVDIAKARNFLGWLPPVSVEQGLRRAFCDRIKSYSTWSS